MKPEAQRIAIAEVCGWTVNPDIYKDSAKVDQTHWYPPNKDDDYHNLSALPDYLTDLNAMHEAEKVLTLEEAEQYFQNLLRICNPAFCASAKQRAEGFLKTKALWKP